jgi:5'-nucleotidase
MHSHLLASTLTLDVPDADGAVEVPYGGADLVAAALKAYDGDASRSTLKLHAGDQITGTLYYSLFEDGAADAAVLAEMCFDAFALGNHEFDDGDAVLNTFLNLVASLQGEGGDGDGSCPNPLNVLGSNISPAAGSALRGSSSLKAHSVHEINGEVYAVVGIDIALKTLRSSSPDAGTYLFDEAATAQAYINALEDFGYDKIILLTHYGYENDLALARLLRGVDIIVGGDSHTLLGDASLGELLGTAPVGPYPTQTTDKDGHQVCVVQAWEYGHLVGEMDVAFDCQGHVLRCEGTPRVPISASYIAGLGGSIESTPSMALRNSRKATEVADKNTNTNKNNNDNGEAILEYLRGFGSALVLEEDSSMRVVTAAIEAEVGPRGEAVVGAAAEDLCFNRIPGRGGSEVCDTAATFAQGSDVTVVVAQAFLESVPTADVALQNAGGVRADVPAGNVTFGAAYELLPFSNTLVTLPLTGALIKAMLEGAVDFSLDVDASTGAYPYAAGLRFDVDASAEEGDRVFNIEVNPRLAGSWVAVDTSDTQASTFLVVTNDYIAGGRDGYDILGTVPSTPTFVDYVDGFLRYVQSLPDRTLSKLDYSQYSTQRFTDIDGNPHYPAVPSAAPTSVPTQQFDYYYKFIDPLSSTLQLDLFLLVTNKTELTYTPGIWDAFPVVYGDILGCGDLLGEVYSTRCWDIGPLADGGNQCGNYQGEGDCYNREHVWPQSWWGGSSTFLLSVLPFFLPSIFISFFSLPSFLSSFRPSHSFISSFLCASFPFFFPSFLSSYPPLGTFLFPLPPFKARALARARTSFMSGRATGGSTQNEGTSRFAMWTIPPWSMNPTTGTRKESASGTAFPRLALQRR